MCCCRSPGRRRLRAKLQSPRGHLRDGGAGLCGSYSVQRQPFQLRKLAGCPSPAFQASGLRSAASLGCAQEPGLTRLPARPFSQRSEGPERGSSHVGESLVPLRPESPSLSCPGLPCTPGRVSPAFPWSKGEGWVCAKQDRGPVQMQEYLAHPIHGFSHIFQLGHKQPSEVGENSITIPILLLRKLRPGNGSGHLPSDLSLGWLCASLTFCSSAGPCP